VKLFQIEEPDGTPADQTAPGAAIGVDASGVCVEVAFAVGGNALILVDRDGFERPLSVPSLTAGKEDWQELFAGARIRAERALARPVTHAVIVVAAKPPENLGVLHEAAEQAGLEIMRLVVTAELAAGSSPALAAAMLAEDLAPLPGPD
jgi:hypothetical protein